MLKFRKKIHVLKFRKKCVEQQYLEREKHNFYVKKCISSKLLLLLSRQINIFGEDLVMIQRLFQCSLRVIAVLPF